jgi:hypothetical protein
MSGGRLHPLVVGWEQFFSLDWQPADHKGRPVVEGHIVNTWGFGATHIRLLVDGLDATGTVVEQQVAWLGADLTPGTRASFEIPIDRSADAYRVAVFSFDWVQRGGGGEQR